MRILFLTHSFNGLSQRLYVELTGRGHEVSIEFDIADSVAEEAVALFRPDLILAPYLRRAMPASIWRHHVCLVVHPGIVGDRGPSALDWAIQEGEGEWGVTVLQANGEMDAGDIWAAETFPMRRAKKSSLYRNEVTAAATRAVLAAVERFPAYRAGKFRPCPLDYKDPTVRGCLRPLMRQEDRRIDWQRDSTEEVLRKLHGADGFPGVRDELFGVPCHLFDAHAERRLRGVPGALLVRREGAVLRATVDGAVWIGHVKRADRDEALKLPVTLAFAEEAKDLPDSAVPLWREDEEDWSPLRYHEANGVGYLHFDFYNGAMGTEQCQRVLEAYEFARSRPTKVIVLLGGADFWSNGIHLNLIEAADSAADESWRNINAIDDVARAVIETDRQLTVAALRGNAGAGGAFLALAADEVWAREAVILNPHYKNMGNLYGSEYWSYLLPRRVGMERARAIMQNRLPLGAADAAREGVVDACLAGDVAAFTAQVIARAEALAAAPDLSQRLEDKRARRARDEAAKPLAAYRDEELEHMRRNFYGFDPSYHVARYHFVHRTPHSWTPRHLAVHRELDCLPRSGGAHVAA
jgi:putative two-component system hydrogenase maturation factor HypX/HoxX